MYLFYSPIDVYPHGKMTSLYSIYGEIAAQGLSECDFLGSFLDPPTYHEALIGVDTTRLTVGAKAKRSSVGDLFPDLLDLEPDDDDMGSLRWLEEADVRDLAKADCAGSDAQDVLHVPAMDTASYLDLSPALLLDQLTPPESPDDQVAPEIYIVREDIEAIMATPLSPIDISLVLDAPTSEPITHPPTPPPIHTTLTEEKFDGRMLTVDASQLGDFYTGVVESLAPSTSQLQSDTGGDSPDSRDKDEDYFPPTKPQRKNKRKRQKTSKKARVKPYRDAGDADLSDPGFDVLTVTMNKKQRKKVQNKNAATRYREKKRDEKTVLKDDEDVLAARNVTLCEKVEQLKREIGYMKDLIAEVNKARGQVQA